MKSPARLAIAALIGFALSPCTSVLGVNIVTNGGFENGNFTGWNENGNTAAAHVGGGSAHSGSYAADFGPTTSLVSISQNLATTPLTTYTVSFSLSHLGSATDNSFIATFGGATLLSLSNSGTFGYTNYTFNVTAAEPVTILQFGFQGRSGFWHLDDVSVQPVSGVPETGSTLTLLGLALVAIEGLRRKLSAA